VSTVGVTLQYRAVLLPLLQSSHCDTAVQSSPVAAATVQLVWTLQYRAVLLPCYSPVIVTLQYRAVLLPCYSPVIVTLEYRAVLLPCYSPVIVTLEYRAVLLPLLQSSHCDTAVQSSPVAPATVQSVWHCSTEQSCCPCYSPVPHSCSLHSKLPAADR